MTLSLFEWLTVYFSAPLKSFDCYIYIYIYICASIWCFHRCLHLCNNLIRHNRYSCQGNDIRNTKKYDLSYLRCLLKIVGYCMAQKFYMECNFMVSGSGRTLKLLKSINCMEMYYTTAMTSNMKLDFIKLNSINF